MKKQTFNITCRGGLHKAVEGWTFKFGFYDCEDTFYIGAYKLGSKWILTDLESGINFGAWSYTKKDLVYYLGKKLLNYPRYTILNEMDKRRDSELNAEAIQALSRTRSELYYPADNVELRIIIGNNWADDTSVLGGGLRPYYRDYNLQGGYCHK